ncbi:MAG: hypothetical protein IPL36_01735 [Nigerium sp.]|nr:hypothetical protein [Nigerium sp.]
MYAALLKHEARLQARPLLSFLGIALAVFAGGLAAMLLRVPLLAEFGNVAAIIVCLLLAVGVPAHLLHRYYTSMYGREGYLTHVIPAKHTALYAAKFTWAAGVWAASLLLTLALAYGIAVAQTITAGGTASDTWAALATALANANQTALALGIAWIAVGLLTYVAQFGWVVTFGMEDRFRSLGLGGPVVVWFVSYLVMQVVTFAAMVLIPVGVTPDFSELVFASFLGELPKAFANEDPSFIPLGWLPVILVALPVYVIWTLHSLKKHTSLR